MNPPRQQRPHFGIASYERVDLVRAQLISQLAQLPKRFTRPLLKTQPQIFVGEQPANHELNRLLRHTFRRGNPRASGQSQIPTRSHVPRIGKCVRMRNMIAAAHDRNDAADSPARQK